MPAKKSISQFSKQTAQRLRANTTATEKRLWKMLQTLPVAGSHFRRQVPIGPYVADFACLASRLVIELDGSQHANPQESQHDKLRTEWLRREGYRVIRFWNSDLNGSPEGVLNSIYAAVYGSIDSEAAPLKHLRKKKQVASHPTPARLARRPSPSRGG